MSVNVFAPSQLSGINMKNRILRSATHEGMADAKGYPTDNLQQLYIRLAKGNIGAIITGYAGIQANGRCPFPGMLMLDNDACVPAFKSLVAAIHAYQTPIIIQLVHSGRQTRSKITGLPTVAPSALRDKLYNEDLPHALTEPEIRELIADHVKAIGRARAAGFDAVQLHAAHGYLLSQFLSPYTNRRQDAWGGSTENRFRILQEIYQQARTLYPDYPIFIKLNAYDQRKNGMRLEEAIKIARLLETAGCAGIEVSGGVAEDGFMSARPTQNPADAIFHFNFKIKNIPPFIRPLIQLLLRPGFAPKLPTHLYNAEAAKAIKAAVSIPVIVVGGIKSLADIQTVLDNGSADYVSLCRPLILEPNLVEKYQSHKQTEAKCIGCNYCMLGIEETPLRCYFGKIPTNKNQKEK